MNATGRRARSPSTNRVLENDGSPSYGEVTQVGHREPSRSARRPAAEDVGEQGEKMADGASTPPTRMCFTCDP